MKTEDEQKLLRIYVTEQDQWKGVPLYEAIVNEARALGMSGATAIRGFLGFGRGACIHTTKLLELSYDLPVVIEIVDTEEKVKMLLPKLDEMIEEGLVTTQIVHTIRHRGATSKQA